MYRIIQNKFMSGQLDPASRLIDLPYIGPYLYERLRRKYAPRSQHISIQKFTRAITNVATVDLHETLQRVLQNERANQCVGVRGKRYHTRDVNEKGWITMVALLRVLKANADGYGIGTNMRANPLRMPYPSARSQAAKMAPCKSRSLCRRPNRWKDGLCQYSDASGFEGIGKYPGQRIHSSRPNTIQRKERDAARLQRSSRDARRDPYTARDVRQGHGGMRYSKVDSRTRQRKPGRIVRLPV